MNIDNDEILRITYQKKKKKKKEKKISSYK
jgi:hypothetical protein